MGQIKKNTVSTISYRFSNGLMTVISNSRILTDPVGRSNEIDFCVCVKTVLMRKVSPMQTYHTKRIYLNGEVRDERVKDHSPELHLTHADAMEGCGTEN